MVSRGLERALGDMSLAQFRVLSLIAASPERASYLAEKAAVSRPSLSGLLDGLETRGWVKRTDVAGDRRGVRLEMTAAGKRALRNAEKAMTTRLDQVLADSDPADRAAVLRGLAVLHRAVVRP